MSLSFSVGQPEIPLNVAIAAPFAVAGLSVPFLLFKYFNHVPETERDQPPIRWFDRGTQLQHEQAGVTLQLLEGHLDGFPAARPIAEYLHAQRKEAVDNNASDDSVLVSFGLGVSMSAGLGLAFLCKKWTNFGLYISSLSLFHLLEYQYALTFQPRECSSESFLLTHSAQAMISIGAAFIEFLGEKFLLTLPSVQSILPPFLLHFKSDWRIIGPAALCVLLFQGIRTTAMWTAGSNFHHQIRFQREEGHKLVTTGIYSISRHPSYFGWFWWAISTQVLLCNPICTIVYTILSWRFFRDRIKDEEETLVRFFGQDYKTYRQRVGVGIPFVTWY